MYIFLIYLLDMILLICILVLLLFFITSLIINIVHYTRNSVFGLRDVPYLINDSTTTSQAKIIVLLTCACSCLCLSKVGTLCCMPAA